METVSASHEAGDQEVALGQLGDASCHWLSDRVVRVGIVGTLIPHELQGRQRIGSQVGDAEVFGTVQVDDFASARELSK